MNPNDFGDPLTLHVAPQTGQSYHFLCEMHNSASHPRGWIMVILVMIWWFWLPPPVPLGGGHFCILKEIKFEIGAQTMYKND